jgi:hypothetical protein
MMIGAISSLLGFPAPDSLWDQQSDAAEDEQPAWRPAVFTPHPAPCTLNPTP